MGRFCVCSSRCRQEAGKETRFSGSYFLDSVLFLLSILCSLNFCHICTVVGKHSRDKLTVKIFTVSSVTWHFSFQLLNLIMHFSAVNVYFILCSRMASTHPLPWEYGSSYCTASHQFSHVFFC